MGLQDDNHQRQRTCDLCSRSLQGFALQIEGVIPEYQNVGISRSDPWSCLQFIRGKKY